MKEINLPNDTKIVVADHKAWLLEKIVKDEETIKIILQWYSQKPEREKRDILAAIGGAIAGYAIDKKRIRGASIGSTIAVVTRMIYDRFAKDEIKFTDEQKKLIEKLINRKPGEIIELSDDECDILIDLIKKVQDKNK
ncbi:MAG: hypothetical protein GXO66_00805 [Euryarchaeota archaeon]|nr:hypothetical protein [Euryarchaeota archaeon]